AYALANKWSACVEIPESLIKLTPIRPEGWIHRSFALRELNRTQEVFDRLLPAANKFQRISSANLRPTPPTCARNWRFISGSPMATEPLRRSRGASTPQEG